MMVENNVEASVLIPVSPHEPVLLQRPDEDEPVMPLLAAAEAIFDGWLPAPGALLAAGSLPAAKRTAYLKSVREERPLTLAAPDGAPRLFAAMAVLLVVCAPFKYTVCEEAGEKCLMFTTLNKAKLCPPCANERIAASKTGSRQRQAEAAASASARALPPLPPASGPIIAYLGDALPRLASVFEHDGDGRPTAAADSPAGRHLRVLAQDLAPLLAFGSQTHLLNKRRWDPQSGSVVTSTGVRYAGVEFLLKPALAMRANNCINDVSRLGFFLLPARGTLDRHQEKLWPATVQHVARRFKLLRDNLGGNSVATLHYDTMSLARFVSQNAMCDIVGLSEQVAAISAFLKDRPGAVLPANCVSLVVGTIHYADGCVRYALTTKLYAAESHGAPLLAEQVFLIKHTLIALGIS